MDVAVFWAGLFTPGVIWALLGVGSLLRFNFEWLLLIVTALSLSMANIVGYVRCRREHDDRTRAHPPDPAPGLDPDTHAVGCARCRRDASSKIGGVVAGLAERVGVNSTVGKAMTSAAGSAFGFGSSA